MSASGSVKICDFGRAYLVDTATRTRAYSVGPSLLEHMAGNAPQTASAAPVVISGEIAVPTRVSQPCNDVKRVIVWLLLLSLLLRCFILYEARAVYLVLGCSHHA